MDFPKRIKQHKNESDSFAIILYKLREIGIFRNVTESDYGIDFEIEVVNGDKVEGHCLRITKSILQKYWIYIPKRGLMIFAKMMASRWSSKHIWCVEWCEALIIFMSPRISRRATWNCAILIGIVSNTIKGKRQILSRKRA